MSPAPAFPWRGKKSGPGPHVPFEREAVQAYLDACISHWRGVRDGAAFLPHGIDEWSVACLYLDAYLGMRMALYGTVVA